MIPHYNYEKFTDEQLAEWSKYIGGRIVDNYNSDIAKVVQRDWMIINLEVRKREKEIASRKEAV